MRLDRIAMTLLLLLAAPLWAQQSRSLGDAARQEREAHLNSPRAARVITNDDLAQPAAEAAAPAETSSPEDAAKDASAKEDGKDAAAAKSEAKDDAKAQKAKTPDELRAEREEAYRKRAEEVNKTYTERIQKLRDQLNSARLQLSKLETARVESTQDFRRSAAMSPTLNQYETQQKEFNEQIATQQELINNLNSQLEDAIEAARHAGVPHADE